MNKKFTKLMAALALLVFMAPSMAGWGQTRSTETFSYGDYTGQGTQGTGSEYTMVKTDVSITNTKFYGNTSYAHFYANGTTTITPKNGITITQVVLTASGTSYNGYQSSGSITASIGSVSGSTSSTTVTWTGSASSYFTISNNKQIRWTSIEVTYTSGGSTTYTVTFDCDGGTGCPEDITGIEEGDDNFTVPSVAPTKEHYGFDGFYIGSDDEMYEPGETYTIESDLELTASWTINKNNVTLNDDNTDAELYAEYGVNLLVEGETVAINYGTELVLGADNLPANHTVVWTVKNISNVDVTADVLSETTVTVPDYAIIITGTVTEIPTYTITFHAGSGTCETESSSGLEGSNITLPEAQPSQACASRGWTFAGWATASVNETTTVPTLYNGTYTITTNVDLYAVYTVEAEGNPPTAFSVGNTGTYAIVSEMQEDNKYYALPTKPTVNSGKIAAQEITVSEKEGVKYITPVNADGFEWTIASATNGYTLYDGSNYIYHSNGGNSGTNLTYGTSTSYTWSFTAVDGCIQMAAMNGTTTNNRGMLFSGTDIGGYSLTNWNTSGYYKTMILPVADATVAIYATSPDCLEKVATPTFTVTGTAIEGEENTYNGAISVTINCTPEDASIQYKLTEDGAWQNYSTALSISQSTTIWAKATKEGMDDSDVAEATYTIKYTLTLAENEDVLPLLFDGEENPIEIDDETRTATIEAGTEVRVSIDMIVNCKVFSGLSVTNVGEGGITEIEPNVYYSFPMPAQNSTLTVTTAETAPQILTVAGLGHINSGELYYGPESDIINLIDLASNEASICGQMNVSIHELTIAANYELQSVTLTIGNTTEEVPMIEGFYTFTMPTSAATLTFNINKITMVVDELTRETTGITGSNYDDWSGKKGNNNSTTVYAGYSAGSNDAIQLRSNNSNSGIITTTSGGKVSKVSVTWESHTSNDRTLNVYGKNTL